VIKLTLLHPLQSTPVRTWNFEEEVAIAIGRSPENDVVLYSSVVSRNHVELKYVNGNWVIINLGKNGTYLNGKAIANAPVVDGMEIELAGSGPKIVINVDKEPPKTKLGFKSRETKTEQGEKEKQGEERTENMQIRKE
jgi:pSer/pThr/pTyr-binding forkhead associated (FHA) protein